jgi:glutamate synthase (ferredoxin)
MDDYAISNYNKAIAKGILKIMNKMESQLCTLTEQIFEILGLNKTFLVNIFHTPL